MEISTRSKVSESTERSPQKRKVPTPTDSSNGCSSAETSPSPVKKKKKPGAVSNSKDQSELRHGPFYYKKQPALTTDPVDVVPQDGRNDFYCWLCHREGQVLCCELCPRVYHAKCLKLPSEPEGDWFCPECEKITVAECIETQSRAMMMLTTEQLSYLLKFALQKMKQPGDHPRLPSRSPHAASTQRKTFNWTEPFQKPVSLDQHPDYAEYIFHPMDLCTLEKNIKKKMYGCTEAFLADVKWILHNCIIYNGGNHKLTTTAKVIVKICEHEMSEIEVCPECYLSACQKRDNWFCEPCSHPHPLVWAKLKGFPFWPAKALRDKDGQVDARFFGQHDRAWVPLNNCYLMSKEIPFSVKKTKSIFNSAMQEMEFYVENMKKKFGVFNYARFRTPYAPDTNFQMLQDPSNPSSNAAKSDKVDKIKLSFDMTASPKVHLARTVFSGLTGGQCVPLGDIPRSPMSTNSSGQTGSDGEQETGGERTKDLKGCGSTAEESQDSTASQSRSPSGPATSSLEAFPATGKQEKTPPIGSILKLNLDRSKADMDLTELSESVQQKQREKSVLSSPKRQIKSRFQLNLDKTIEICKAQLGIDDISNEEYKGVEHSDSEESVSSDSDTGNVGQEATPNEKTQRTPEDKDKPSPSQNEKTKPESTTSDGCASQAQQKNSTDSEKESSKKTKTTTPPCTENVQVKEEPQQQVPEDSDSERELVIDLGEESGSKTRKRSRKGSTIVTEAPANKPEGKSLITAVIPSQSSPTPVTVSSQSSVAIPVTVVSFSTSPSAAISLEPAPPSSSITPGLKKQRPLLPRETVPVVQRAVVWSSPAKFQTSPPKWHMQKVQHQDQKQALSASSSPVTGNNSRYQTRQHAKAVQQKDSPLSTVTLVSTSPPSVAVIAASGADTPASSLVPETYIPTASADVAEDIARYTNKIMDAIKGTMSELYSDLSKSSSDTTLAEIRRLRIEIEKLQWLHQQELSEMKHNLELTMAEMRQSLEQERERLVSEAKKQMEVEKQQAMDETKKKQWCANCKKEAIFYCCWNTSYCDYPCQQAHWPEHMKSCTQSATSLQQEAEAESTADLPNKSLAQSSGRPNTVHEAATPVASDNSSSVDKSSDNINMP